MSAQSTTRHVVATVGELKPGTSKIVDVAGRSIGVIRTANGRVYALRNACPHHGAALCAGEVTGTMLPSAPHEYRYDAEETVVRCPWHGYPFRLEDGRCATRPDKLRVKTYPVEIEGEDVVLYV